MRKGSGNGGCQLRVEGVRFVRLWVLSNHVPGGAAACPGPFTGCLGTSVAELEVYGTPAR